MALVLNSDGRVVLCWVLCSTARRARSTARSGAPTPARPSGTTTTPSPSAPEVSFPTLSLVAPFAYDSIVVSVIGRVAEVTALSKH
jgi:hypothetical protein